MSNQEIQIIEVYKKCDAFFSEILNRAVTNQGVQISEEANFYLLSVVLVGLKVGPNHYEQSLAEKFLIAQRGGRFEDLKLVGDLSLIIAGLWWQSLIKKLVDVDYYIDLGSCSYRQVGEIGQIQLSDLFEELSQNFTALVNVLIEVSLTISEARDDRGLWRMYEVWQRTGNQFLEAKLREHGINVVSANILIH